MSASDRQTVELRFFASARAAMGANCITIDLPGDSTIESVLGGLAANDDRLGAVFGRCSFLVNGIATTDRDRSLTDGDRVDVLPPFAGG
jgi:molybdopterin synthase sulfur carrier subunit